MIKPPAGKSQTRGDVLALQIRQLFEHLIRRQPRGEQIQHVRHADAKSAYAGTSPALVRVYGDPIGKGGQFDVSVTGYTRTPPAGPCPRKLSESMECSIISPT